MTPSDGIQSAFLEHLKSKLGPNTSLADEMAELLAISRDSAYRRIRGETILSLDEVSVLTRKFGISLDGFLSPSGERVSFQFKSIGVDENSFEKWFKSILDNLESFLAAPGAAKEMFYDTKDLPIFHYFQFPRLAAFKIYFWMKTFSGNTKFASVKYDARLVDNKLLSMGEKIWEVYSRIPSTEIITYELINVTLRQIEYAFECGMFNDKKEALLLCDDCAALVNHLQLQAQTGTKQTFRSDATGAKFSLFLNEVLIGSNSILFTTPGTKVVFITPNNFNILMTTHEQFCEITAKHLDNLMQKSTLISASANKERSKFFNRIADSVEALRLRIT